MRIVIDLQGAQTESRFRGIGRYSLFMAQAIVRNRKDHEVFIVLNGSLPNTISSIRDAFHGLLPQNNIRIWYAAGPLQDSNAGNEWRRKTAELTREGFIASLKPDMIYITSLFEGYGDNAIISVNQFDKTTPVSVSLYDLIPYLNPDQYLAPYPRFKHHYLKQLKYCSHADLLLSISKSARQEGVNNLQRPKSSIVNVYTAANEQFKPLYMSAVRETALLRKLNLRPDFILYTGGVDDRKNLTRLIHAYGRLPKPLRKKHQLVFVGRIPEGNMKALRQDMRDAKISPNDLAFAGYISEEDLIELYNTCRSHIFPSWHEGFGLPALEAMACGAPTIGANTSSLPEVFGNADALFDPFSISSISNKLEQVLTDEEFRQGLIEKGLIQAKKFSWDNTAKAAITAFESFLKTAKPTPVTAHSASDVARKISENLPSTLTNQDLMKVSYALSQTFPTPHIKQLLVDISELCQRDAGTGVQRVTRNLLLQMLRNPPAGFIVRPIYATPETDGYLYETRYTSQMLGHAQPDIEDQPLDIHAGDVFLGLDLQHVVVLAQKEYLDKLQRRNVSILFLIHDMLPIDFPEHFAPEMFDVHTQWLKIISAYDGLICVSATTEGKVKAWVKDNYPERLKTLHITSSHNGADISPALSPEPLSAQARKNLRAFKKVPSFIVVGTIEPRKGQKQVLEAFDLLWARGDNINLIFVGKVGWFMDDFIEELQAHPQLNKHLFWLKGIADNYLTKVYSTATCLIAASQDEGFGLPLIEAAQHKLPIIARDIPVFREVAGSHAAYFKGEDRKGLARFIQRWLKRYTAKTHALSHNMPWVTWEQSAQHLAEIITQSCNTQPKQQIFLDITNVCADNADMASLSYALVQSLLQNPDHNMFRMEFVYASPDESHDRIYKYAHKYISQFKDLPVERDTDEYIEYQTGDIFIGLQDDPQIYLSQNKYLQKMRDHGVSVHLVFSDNLTLSESESMGVKENTSVNIWLELLTKIDGMLCPSSDIADTFESFSMSSETKRARPLIVSCFQPQTEKLDQNWKDSTVEIKHILNDIAQTGQQIATK